MFSKFLLFASFIIAVMASPVFRDLVVHEQRDTVPYGFVKSGAAPADQVLNLRMALHNTDMAGLEKALYDVSTPDSAHYGQHLTKEEVEEFVKPDPKSVSIVNDFLTSHGVTAKSISPAGDWLAFSVPVSKAKEMFDADFFVFQHKETGKQYVRTLAYSIPTELQGHLDLVHPTITFENPFADLPVVSSPLSSVATAQNLTTGQSVPSSCSSKVTPACLQALYGIPTTRATQSSNTLGVSGFIDQFANKEDLTLFLEALRPDLPSSTTFKLQTLDGGSNSQDPASAGVEANLDIQYTVGVASGVPTTFISVGDNFKDGALNGFLDITNFLLKESNPPQVLSTSYGQNENTMSRALANQLCNAYMQLGARGTSILFASGDGGVSGSQANSCSTFVPTFPSGCPFMTSVGATTLASNEVAATLSSGGFSNYFGTPSYQASSARSYLASLGKTNAGLFNRTGRGFPDISAQGEKVEVAVNGEGQLVAGTSCASPIFASVIALLNDRLIAAKKPPLGFLNPFLYSAKGQEALNDITSGDNPGCGTNGFPATKGWDPVTGLGSPNFPALLHAVGL
ncbi:family S53 protease [Phellopilus nigrolimitatus]|nr:family S53 protease [Phellopilus nigrolimitatus]